MNTIQEVPFELQEDESWCWPTAIKLILEFLWHNISLSELYELTEFKWDNIPTINLAIAIGKLWHKSDFYTNSLIVSCWDNNTIDKARKNGVKLDEKSLTLDEIIFYTKKDYLPVMLVDWNIILEWLKLPLDPEILGFRWHFVPVVWYDENNIYIHSHSKRNVDEIIWKNIAINKKLFNEARITKWTDEDILIIHRKVTNYLSTYTQEKTKKILWLK